MMVKYRTVKPRNKCKSWKLLEVNSNKPKLSDVVNIIQYQFLVAGDMVDFPPTHVLPLEFNTWLYWWLESWVSTRLRREPSWRRPRSRFDLCLLDLTYFNLHYRYLVQKSWGLCRQGLVSYIHKYIYIIYIYTYPLVI